MKSVDRKLTNKLLGLNQSATVQDLMDFLMSPEDKGRHAPSKRKSKTPAKRRRSSAKDEEEKVKPVKKKSATKSKPKAKVAAKKKKAVPKKQDTDDEVDSLSESDSESVSEDNGQDNDTNPTKKRKLSESITDISKDDSFSGPSDEDLIGSIEKTVEEIDLEEVSMKEALKKIYDLYPGVDLTDRKSFIKDHIRKLIG